MSRYSSRSFMANGATAVARWGIPSFISSLQTGTISLTLGGSASAASAISPVALDRSLLFYLGHTAVDSGDYTRRTSALVGCRLSLSATQVVATTDASVSADIVVGYKVIELVPGVLRSVQAGTIATVLNSAPGTATITAVDMTKALLIYLGCTSDVGRDSYFTRLSLATTTVTATITDTTGVGTSTVGYMVGELAL